MELGFGKRQGTRAAVRHLQDKENVCPDGKQGLVGSPLPEGHPRKPLQDITDVLASIDGKESDLDCGPSKKGKRVALKVREQSKIGVEAKINVAEKTISKQGKSKSGRASIVKIAEQVTLVVESDLEQPVVAKVEPTEAAAASEASAVPPDGAVGSRQRKIHSPPALEVGAEASKSQRKRRKSRLESKPAAPKAELKQVTSNIRKFR